MQTFEEIAEEYAKEKGWSSIEAFLCAPISKDAIREISFRVAQQAIEAQREADADAAFGESKLAIRYTPLITLK